MAKSESAFFRYGLDRAIFIPHNADKTRAAYDNLIGDAGTLDFTSAADKAAVEGTIRVDGGAEQDFDIDLDDVGITIGAVTPAQWATAVTAGLTDASISGFTASVDATTGRCKLVRSTEATIVEVYGEVFEMAGFGQGKGVKARVCEELESSTPAPTRKEDKTVAVENAQGIETSVIVKGYKTGSTVTIVDLGDDYDLKALIEGGTIDADGAYFSPSAAQSKAAPSFELWIIRKNYAQGENQENDFVGYEWVKYYNGSGSVAGGAMNAGFDKFTYNLSFINYLTGGAEEYRTLATGTDAATIAILEAI